MDPLALDASLDQAREAVRADYGDRERGVSVGERILGPLGKLGEVVDKGGLYSELE